jgi:hypothetical protein
MLDPSAGAKTGGGSDLHREPPPVGLQAPGSFHSRAHAPVFQSQSGLIGRAVSGLLIVILMPMPQRRRAVLVSIAGRGGVAARWSAFARTPLRALGGSGIIAAATVKRSRATEPAWRRPAGRTGLFALAKTSPAARAGTD